MGKGIEDEKHLNTTDLQRKCNEKFSYSADEDAPVEPLSKEKRITGELKVMSYKLYCQNHFNSRQLLIVIVLAVLLLTFEIHMNLSLRGY